MASNTRIRIEPDIEDYLRSQSERVIGKAGDTITGAEVTTLANRLLYEHKLAQSMAKQVPFARLFNSFNRLVEWLPGIARNVIAMPQSSPSVLKEEAISEPDNFDFDADFAAQFEDEAA
ncbi:hypothetical protein H6F96_31835 [Microcoleus sp. FACHB-53]|nr:hypothetical protein [Microcoleus sp. FACHB-53]